MLILIHSNNKPIRVVDSTGGVIKSATSSGSIAAMMFELSKSGSDKIIGWCDERLIGSVDFSAWEELSDSPYSVISFNPDKKEYIPPQIGYADMGSPLTNINKSVRYGTWMLSSAMGVIHADIFNRFEYLVQDDFDLFLSCLGMCGYKNGLFLYSDPRMLRQKDCRYTSKVISTTNLFRFVKRYYTRNLFYYLFIAYFFLEKKVMLLPVLNTLLRNQLPEYKSVTLPEVQNGPIDNGDTIDVLIPTLGRKETLYNVLQDLNTGDLVPARVIIVEQKAEKESQTDLDYLYNQSWNFEIVHRLIYQLGACNARNTAIDQVKSKWVFFADDDIRIERDTIKSCVEHLKTFGYGAATVAVYMNNETIDRKPNPILFNTFGSGCSIVDSTFVKDTYFKMGFEFGYGEDANYGCQLRNKGCAVVFYNKSPMLHLKAPIGGFRHKIEHPWLKDDLQPKPSPQVCLHWISDYSKHQLKATRLLLWIRMIDYRKNPFKQLVVLKKRWRKSFRIAIKLREL